MTKDEFGDLLAEIGGGHEIGIVSRHERDAAEHATLSTHETEIWGLLCLGDALHQFYRDTLGLVGQALSTKTVNPSETAMAHWHLVSFNRFAAAFHLMANGYYFEAMMLARDLWEVGLTLASLQKNVVTLDELLATGTTPSETESLSRKVDQKIRKVLIYENQALSPDARGAVETFGRLANLATHKSKLQMGMNLGLMVKKEPILLFPHFDLKRAEVAHNLLFMGSWALLSTLPYLAFALPPSEVGWHTMYGKVQTAFQFGLASGPNAAVQAWPEVIQRVFG
jgi:hypothetical protein